MFEAFIKYLSFEKRYSQHTIVAYAKDIAQFESFIEREFEVSHVNEIDHTHLRSWIIFLVENDQSPTSVNRKIATLKSLFKFLVAREEIASNPASRLKPLKTEKKLPSFLKENEVSALLDHIDFGNSFTGKRDQLILELFYLTGMRLSEMVGLKNIDINQYDGSVKVRGKRNKERIIPISKTLITQINDFLKIKELEGYESEFLILTDSGKPVYPMFIQRKVESYLRSATTLSKKSPHVLRHTFATHLLNKGADLNAVKDLLGHTSLAATQVYTHNSIEKLKEAFNQAHPKA